MNGFEWLFVVMLICNGLVGLYGHLAKYYDNKDGLNMVLLLLEVSTLILFMVALWFWNF